MKYIVKHKLKSTENLKLLLLFLFFFCMTVHKRNSKLFYCSFFYTQFENNGVMIKMWFEMYTVFTNSIFFFSVLN